MQIIWFLIFFLPALFFVIYVLTSSKRKGIVFEFFMNLANSYFLANSHAVPKGKVAVNNSSISVPLLEKKKVTHDTYEFSFKLPEDDMVLGIGVGQCIALSYLFNQS